MRDCSTIPTTRRLVVALLLVSGLSTIACSATTQAPAPSRAEPPRPGVDQKIVRPSNLPARRILILTSQGVAPENDNPAADFNGVVRRLHEAFAGVLQAELGRLGKETKAVLNQDPSIKVDEFLARSVEWPETDAVITLRLESEPRRDGLFDISLTARFMPLVYFTQGGRNGLIPQEGTDWIFPLTTPDGSGWRDNPISEEVKPFIEALKARGEI
jgi:hypothetical protein